MSKTPDNKPASSRSRILLWTVIGLAVGGFLLWDQYDQGNLKPYLVMIGLEEESTPAKRSTSTKSEISSKSKKAPADTVAESNAEKSAKVSAEADSTKTQEPGSPPEPVAETVTTEVAPEQLKPVPVEPIEASTDEVGSPSEESVEVTDSEATPAESEPSFDEQPVPAPDSAPVISEVDSASTTVEEKTESEDEVVVTEAPPSPEPALPSEPKEEESSDFPATESALDTLTNSTRINRPDDLKPESVNASIPTKVFSYANRVLKKYDLDRSTSLEPAEYQQLSDAESLKQADVDGNQKITLQELAQYMANYGEHRRIRLLSPYSGEKQADEPNRATNSEAALNPDDQPEPEKSAEEKEQTRRRSLKYAVKPSRLPEGLPNWFLGLDRNGDAQLSISEFAPSAGQLKVDEFRKLDLNSDGLVTPEEYKRAPKGK
ncbi:EF hand [Polystyrenella longa]|uniref:EF hand n=1 Tax=Polystyrenella longa TaxID=2528007 RepID=A0A518CNT0_9PLAN|nr:EF-hand domain-containing protein [Polystyrenella longa]QDU80868.1 EF hand [Polystyrenella longa]